MATAPALYEYEPIPVPPPGGLLATAVGTPMQPQPPVDPATQAVAPPLAAPPAFAASPTSYENDDAVGFLNSITDADSGYMKVARTAGLAAAHKRGLLNTSMAAGASQTAAIAAAAPFALQNAQQAGQRNFTRLSAYYTGEQQEKDIAARKQMLAEQLRSEEERLGRQLTSQETMQFRDISARMEMQGIDLSTQRYMQQQQIRATDALATKNIEAEMARLGRQLTSAEMMQQRDIAAQATRQTQQLAMQRYLTEKGYATEIQKTQMSEAGALTRAQLDAKTRTALATMENATQQQTATLNYYTAQDQIYAQSISSLYANAEMPAPARDAAMQQFLALKNANLNLPAAIYGTGLTWNVPTPAPLPRPPASPAYGGPGTTSGGGTNPLSSDGIPHNDGVRTLNGAIVG